MKKQLNEESRKTKCEKLEEKIRGLEGELDAVLALFHGIKDAIVFVDKSGRIVRVNKTVTEVGGYREKEIIGKRLAALKGTISPKSLPKIMAIFAKRMVGTASSSYEIILKTKKGRKLNVEVHSNPLKRKGKIIGTVAVLRDITERKKIEKALEARSKELEKMNKLMVGRELKMLELKKRIEELGKRL